MKEGFMNTDCEYYPCHDLRAVNCLFCFCPLYRLDCGGDFRILPNGDKDCSDCTIPHGKDGYKIVIRKLQEDQAQRKLDQAPRALRLDEFGHPSLNEINKLYEKLHAQGSFLGGGDIDEILQLLLDEGIINGVYNKDEG